MFHRYDLAWEKYQKSLKLLPLPIVSWDFYQQLPNEIKTIESIQESWTEKINFAKDIANKSVIITDSSLKIIYVTPEIAKLTGYSSREIVGNTPKMFQGNLTDVATRNKIREAVKNQHPFKEIVINYKKDGTSYKCEIEAYPKFDANNNLVHYIAFEKIAS
ncbi:PAS domain-containing protein [Flavobacterium difficile]|uniref:PAS domain-containing protein n=1 Tax=Flavobacterium difficile TaxID=2709659 RepID=A0ABX0I6Q8_9FLAO|nr:PAS domain-containing protein [Flavobacterium difficile]NHM02312.1 PAS domain-containing protein [Flavobacterium difficile]